MYELYKAIIRSLSVSLDPEDLHETKAATKNQKALNGLMCYQLYIVFVLLLGGLHCSKKSACT